ncbi:hypothetical protein ROZALSC1DRAFT_2154, partial [Rozella allomycis CSF55]
IFEELSASIFQGLFALTMFRNSVNSSDFNILLCGLFCWSCFHWIYQHRSDLIVQVPNLGVIYHVKMASATLLITFIDLSILLYCFEHLTEHGVDLHFYFLYNISILFVGFMFNLTKYVLNLLEMFKPNEWHDKSLYLFYAELVQDLLKVIVLCSYFYMVTISFGLPLYLIRDCIFSFASLIKKIKQLLNFHKTMRDLQNRYPDATPDELASGDRVCIICRENMDTAKRLSCGHLFHFNCLRRWIERHNVCPTCRQPL